MTSDQILTEQKNKNKTSLTITVVLLAAGLVLLFAKQWIGGLFIVAGAVLGAGLLSRTKDIKAQLEKAGGEAGLCDQLSAEQTVVFDKLDAVLTPELAVVYRPFFKVHVLKDMAKFEVGIGPEGVQKALFLTAPDGTRNKIAQVQKGDGRQEDFDALYEMVRGYFADRAAGSAA
ncbi:MAG: hypothetical protein K6A91_02640 [Clostridia bacterium]|nr:hypothetical protein [Clostridia bacterium]